MPERAIVRLYTINYYLNFRCLFMEVLVRIADEKYLKHKKFDNLSSAL